MFGPVMTDALEMRPLTGERWADLEALFGSRGACADHAAVHSEVASTGARAI